MKNQNKINVNEKIRNYWRTLIKQRISANPLKGSFLLKYVINFLGTVIWLEIYDTIPMLIKLFLVAKRSKLNVQVNIWTCYIHVILFLSKTVGLQAETWLYKGLQHRCFPINFVKFSRTHILWNNCRLLLYWVVKCIM